MVILRTITVVATAAVAGIVAMTAPSALAKSPQAVSSATPTPTPTPTGTPAPYEPVMYWNKVLENPYRQFGGAPGPLSRKAAIMHAAMYDAANSVTTIGRPYLAKVPLTGPTSMDAAIATAAFTTFKAMFPTYTDSNGHYQYALRQIPESVPQADRDRGIAVGRAAAEAILKARSDDGSDKEVVYPSNSTTPGAWRSTENPPIAAATPHWGNVRPFTLTRPDQFRPVLPGGFTNYADLLRSDAYAQQVEEVRALGGAQSTATTTVTRTPEQATIAEFWANDLDGTYKPPAQLYQHTRIIARKKQLTVAQNAKLFAAVTLAVADAGIVAWDAKYNTAIDLWRPESAIKLADSDGNPKTIQDADWKPLSFDKQRGTHFSPSFPAFISGHATFAAAWAGTMRAYFNVDVPFSATTDDSYNGGITRRFNTFEAAAEENAVSRIYLGVHYRWDAEQGLAAGYATARHVAGTFLN